MILDAEMRARLERLSLRSKRRVHALWAGRHASAHKGESLDFADYREYTPGDDFRRIDHQLWARLGVVLIRQFEAEEEMPLRIVLDASASMTPAKYDTARTLAAALAYLGLAGGDRVDLLVTPGADGRAISQAPRARHLGAWPAVEAWLESIVPGGAASLDQLPRIVASAPARGSVVVVSDLLDEAWVKTIDGLGAVAGGVVLHVLAPSELDPELSGDLRLVDAESGETLDLSASADTLARYRQTLAEFLDEAAARSRRGGLDYVLAPAVPGAVDKVIAALARSGVLA